MCSCRGGTGVSGWRWVALVALLGVLAAACAPTPSPVPATATLAPATPAPTPAVGAAPLAEPSSSAAGAQAPGLALVLTISGSPGPLDRPNAVTVDRQGRIYVGEMSPGHTVQIFDRDGTFVRKWGGQGGRDAGQFN
jgi:NHL repeat